MNAVLAAARLSFLDMIAYRVRYVVGILNYTIYLGVQYFLWSAVFASSTAEDPGGVAAGGASGPTLAGFTLQGIVTYFAVGWILRVSAYNNLDRELAERVSRGDIALDLLRPVSVLTLRYGQALGESFFRLFFMGIPTALIFFPLFGVAGPALPSDPAGAALRILALFTAAALSFHVFFLLNFLVGLAAIFLEKIQGFLWAKFVLVQFLSGLLVPFDFFPPWARACLAALPFRAIQHAPGQIYLGRLEGAALGRELGLQAAWTVALYLAARLLWARARRKLVVQGG